MSDLMQRQLDDLGKMTTSDLVQRYEDLHGHKCRTRHRAYLSRLSRRWRCRSPLGWVFRCTARPVAPNDPLALEHPRPRRRTR